MEKEKIRFGRVLLISIFASFILMFIIITVVGVLLSRSHSTVSHPTSLTSREAQAQNGQFEAYFGDHVSATEVKQLLSLVRTNNITENFKVFINNLDTIDNTSIPGGVKTGDYYVVGTMNDNAISPEVEISDTNNQGYYKNGYIRNIKITPATKSVSNNTIQSDNSISNIVVK